MEQGSIDKLCILPKNFEKSQLAGRMLPAQLHIDFSTSVIKGMASSALWLYYQVWWLAKDYGIIYIVW